MVNGCPCTGRERERERESSQLWKRLTSTATTNFQTLEGMPCVCENGQERIISVWLGFFAQIQPNRYLVKYQVPKYIIARASTIYGGEGEQHRVLIFLSYFYIAQEKLSL